MRLPKLNEVPNLDILRSIAVLLVLVDHSAEFFGVRAELMGDLGRTGVYLFFVHTSLVLMLSLERQEAKSERRVALTFYLRRLFRIYPLSIVSVLLMSICSIPARNVAGAFQLALQPPEPGNIVSNLALTMNLTGHVPILGQLWSLPLEVQMYLLLPTAYLLSRRFGVPGMLTTWGLAVAVALAHDHFVFPGSWRLSLFTYIPCFLPGIIAYSLWRIRPRIPAILWLPALLSLCAAYYAIGTQVACWCLCLAVGLAVPFFHQVETRWLTLSAHYVAKYSYGIYLFHLLALWIGFNALHIPFVFQTVVWLVLLVLIPMAAYHLVESPCVGFGARMATRLSHPPRRIQKVFSYSDLKI